MSEVAVGGLSSAAFIKEFVQQRRPVIIRGAATTAHAMGESMGVPPREGEHARAC